MKSTFLDTMVIENSLMNTYDIRKLMNIYENLGQIIHIPRLTNPMSDPILDF